MASSFLPAVLFFGLTSALSEKYDDKIITKIKINATTETLATGGDFSIGCTLITAEMSAERTKRSTPEDAMTSPVFLSSSLLSFSPSEEEEVEEEEESSQSSRVHPSSHYSEPASAFKVASGNTLQTLMSRVQTVKLELYRFVPDKNINEVVARYDLLTKTVSVLTPRTPSLVAKGKEEYREAGPWKIYTTEIIVTYSQAQCLDEADFQCFGKIELDGKTKYATDFGLRVNVESCKLCQDGSALFDKNCYKVISQEADYATANIVCKHRGDHLVTISSERENDFVSRLVRNHAHTWRNLFIGLADQTQNRVYQWTNGMKSNYRHWSLTQPNSTSGQSCATLGMDGAWYDESCSSKLPYICEKPNSAQENDNNDNSPHGCGPSWMEFMGACYKLHASSKTWDAARQHCQGELAQLVEIRTSAENEFIKAVARQQSISDLFMGLHSSEKEPKKFVWQSGEAPIFTDWHPGEPNGNSAQCGYMHGISLKWDDIDCSKNLPFVCEMPMYRKG